MISLHRWVAPYTGAWIEIAEERTSYDKMFVAPYTGAWIEIPSKGLRYLDESVAPYTGAWIEISSSKPTYCVYPVAPFAGVTIDILEHFLGMSCTMAVIYRLCEVACVRVDYTMLGSISKYECRSTA